MKSGRVLYRNSATNSLTEIYCFCIGKIICNVQIIFNLKF